MSDHFWFAVAWLGMSLPGGWRLSQWLTKRAARESCPVREFRRWFEWISDPIPTGDANGESN